MNKYKSLYESPFKLIAILAASIFITETIDMFVIYALRPFPSDFIETMFDSSFQLVLLAPIMYFLIFRPMLHSMNSLEKAEEDVVKLNEELEQRVTDRTAELEKTNADLMLAKKELEKTYEELKSAHIIVLHQEKMASIGQLAAGVAHEINNPVGFISSNLNSLHKYVNKINGFLKMQTEAIEKISADGADQSGEILDNIQRHKKSIKLDYIIDDLENLIKESLDGTERVKKIVYDLKSFSRNDEKTFQIADINAGIESTINIVWNELKYKATLEKDLGDIPRTKCNIGQLNQVFLNMLVNASQAIPAQGKIAVRTWSADGHIHISFSDTGTGISPELIDKIFDPFFTTKDIGCGTGLGLSIAYDIVKKHSGQISVNSEIGKGTTFTISIPITED